MRLHTSCILAAAIALHAAWADTPRFDRVFGSHMVLPHGKNIPVSGTAAPNREITVTFGNTALKTKTDSKGKWSVTLPPMPPCATGQTLAAVQNGDSAKLEDVLVGEVWLASGQSNMLFRLNQTTTAKEDIAASGDDQLRLLNNVPQAHTNNAPYSAKDFDAVTTDNFYKGQWAASSPATSGPMTAVGYYFGKKLREGLGIPVGIIHSSLGGSEIAAWIPRQVINANNSFRTLRGNHWLDSPLISDWVRGRARKNISPRLNQGSPDHPYKPAFLYESGIAWTTALPITGVIWYQGESNAGRYMDYAARLFDMVSLWRGLWGRDDLPFYYVEIAPFEYGNGKSPYLREAQCRAQELIPNSGMICTNDLVEPYEFCNVHPKNKRDVGYRLAFMALNKTYGMKEIACQSPQYESMEIRDGKAHVRFKYMDQGFNRMADIRGFEICGADKVFYPADAVVENQFALVVSSEKVPEPVAVRYCFRDFQPGNLGDTRELPVVPFRTDDF